MNRDSFISLLVRAVQDRLITESKASELLRAFDRGEIEERDLPQTVSESSEPIDRRRMELALVGLLLFLGLKRDASLPRFSGLAQRRLLESLLSEFASRARLLATAYGRAESVLIWQQGMQGLITDTMIQARMLGAGHVLLADELLLLQSPINTQLTFLSRFADKITVMELAGTPLSVAQIGSRAESYAGAARGQFYAAKLQGESGLVDYIALDDGSTCASCFDADAGSPYPASQAPLPGDICYGGSRCRCRLEVRAA